VAAGAIGSSRVGEEIRGRVEARLAAEFPTLNVQVQGASLVQGEGIVVRGVSLVDPKMPQQWRQLLWIDELRLACTTSLTELAAGPPRITAVQVRRPVVHAVRHNDGTWNLARLWRQRSPGGLVPVSVEDATLLIDDTCRKMRATLRQVACEVQPVAAEPGGQAWATIRGSVAGDLFERAGFQGRCAPASGEFEFTGDVESLDLSPRLAAFLPEAEGKPGAEEAKDWLTGLRGRCHLACGGIHSGGELARDGMAEAVDDQLARERAGAASGKVQATAVLGIQ
jgi:hypothetical protein